MEGVWRVRKSKGKRGVRVLFLGDWVSGGFVCGINGVRKDGSFFRG